MKTGLVIKLLAIPLVLSALILTSAGALAHERREVAKYQLVVGFLVEPAIEGQKNGVDLRVSNKETQKPVEGIEQTLQVEITHVPSGASKVFKLRPLFRDPGHYTADLLPTAPGDYRFRFFGTIEGVSLNEAFESKSEGGGFGGVESAADIQFPVKLAEAREIQGAARGAQEAARTAQDAASSARGLALAGIAAGVLGMAAGVVSLAAGRKR